MQARQAIGAGFLSTLPVRGATGIGVFHKCLQGYFYPRSPRGERPFGASFMMPLALFLSTLPARGATSKS